MVGQVLVEQAHVARPVEGHRLLAAEHQLAGGEQFVDARGDAGRIDEVGPFAHQAHDHRVVAAVADAGG
ncbi:hypothetical protein D3C80_1899870 [compost metagenome]